MGTSFLMSVRRIIMSDFDDYLTEQLNNEKSPRILSGGSFCFFALLLY